MDALTLSLKKMVIQECRARGVKPEQVADEDQVIGGTGVLQLDSLDAVEIATSVERNFGLKAEQMGSMKNIFRSYKLFSEFIATNAPEERIKNFIEKYH